MLAHRSCMDFHGISQRYLRDMNGHDIPLTWEDPPSRLTTSSSDHSHLSKLLAEVLILSLRAFPAMVPETHSISQQRAGTTLLVAMRPADAPQHPAIGVRVNTHQPTSASRASIQDHNQISHEKDQQLPQLPTGVHSNGKSINS